MRDNWLLANVRSFVSMLQLIGWLDDFAWGAAIIAALFAVASVLTIVFGIIGAAAKLAGGALRRTATIYVTFFRGTPELLILLLGYYGSAVTLTAIARWFDPATGFVDVAPFWAGAFILALMAGAYATETFEGALRGVDKGLIDAGRALGLTRRQTFFLVQFPQAWRIALPGLNNHMISLVKDTALVSVIGLNEIMFTAKQAISITNEPFTMYAVVAAIYLAFTTALTRLGRTLETKAAGHLAQ